LAAASDGSLCVSGSTDLTVKVWDLFKRCHVFTFTGHSDEVHAVAISPDGLNIVSGGADMTIRLWHRRTGLFKGELNADQTDICCLQFSFDGSFLVSGGSDGTIKVWNFARGMLVTTYTGHEDRVSSLATCPSNHSLVRLISGSWDETIKFWSLPLPGGSGPSHSGDHAASSSVQRSESQIATNETVSSQKSASTLRSAQSGSATGVVQNEVPHPNSSRMRPSISG
jgi:WD40 repeat protein